MATSSPGIRLRLYRSPPDSLRFVPVTHIRSTEKSDDVEEEKGKEFQDFDEHYDAYSQVETEYSSQVTYQSIQLAEIKQSDLQRKTTIEVSRAFS